MTHLPQEVRTWWLLEIERCNDAIEHITSSVKLFQHMVTDMEQINELDLAQEYRDHVAFEQNRLEKIRAQKQRIRDYLAGKIGPWW